MPPAGGSAPGLNSLPEYPRFTALEWEHHALLRASFAAAAPCISEFTFAYQWMWQPHTHCRLSQLHGVLVLAADVASGKESYLLPPVTSDDSRAAELIVDVLEADNSTWFARVPEALSAMLGGCAGLVVTEERGRADYVYRGRDLRELPGRHFQKKQNHIRRFRNAFPDAKCLVMDAALAEQASEFCRQWLAGHQGREDPGLQREVDTTLRMLRDREALGLRGGVVMVGERVAGFSLGEQLNPETFVVRVEKADSALQGAYQVINQDFARSAAADFEWINREQDLDVPGLRRAKESYFPHHLVRKFRIRRV